MLIGTLPRLLKRRLCLCIRNEPFRLVLEGVLREWHYFLQENPADSDLVLAEDGFPVGEEAPPVLWLTRSRSGEPGKLDLPLSMEELWANLESRFHKSPRNHIRTNPELPATLEMRNETDEILLTSLSDMGGRFNFHRELPPGEEMVLGLSISGRRFKLPGQVIYTIPTGELKDSGESQVGVVFIHRDKSTRELLREFIIRTCFMRVREGMAGDILREGLSHFDVSPAILREIESA